MAEKTEQKPNIHERLQKLKVDVAKSIKGKSGKNDFKNFNYLELTDFLPQTNELEIQYGLSSKLEPFTVTDKETGLVMDYLRLVIRCFDNPQEGLSWELPIKSAAIQGATEIQNYGGALTYTRRYLWTLALDLAVPDVLDAKIGSKDLITEKPVQMITPKQKGMVLKVDPTVLDEMLRRLGKETIDDLTIKEASEIIEWQKRKERERNGTGNG